MADVQKRARLIHSIDKMQKFVTDEESKEEFMQLSIGDLDARIMQLSTTYKRALDEQFEVVDATVEQQDKLLQERVFDEAEVKYLSALGNPCCDPSSLLYLAFQVRLTFQVQSG